MSIAEKLATIGENQQKVYDAGYEAGKAEGGGGEDYLRLCNKPNFPGLGMFNKEEVVLNFDIAYNFYRMLYTDWGYPTYNNTKVRHLVLNIKQKVLNVAQLLGSSDEVLEHLTINGDLSQCTAALQMFSGCYALKIVDGTPLDLSSATQIGNIITTYHNQFEEIRFAPNSIKVNIGFPGSSVLSDATIQSIVDGLAEVETAQTLTVHADVGAKLTDAQKATITAKNWTLVY